MIKIRNLAFEYFDRDREGNLTEMIHAIREVSFDAQKGEFIAIAGKNGSGKSTFARILNRLLVPIEGTVDICGYDAMDENNILEIRKRVGMVFQNPDEQLIGSIIAEDVAFGAENIGMPQKKLWDSVLSALEQVGLVVENVTREEKMKAAHRKINSLSGGEKQKVAIAGVLAMKPSCIVFDEATSMLDPISRRNILQRMKDLNEETGITIIWITHLMEELLVADTIYIMENGKIVHKGKRETLFQNRELLEKHGLAMPAIMEVRNRLLADGFLRDRNIFSVDQLVLRLKKEHPRAFLLDTKLPNAGETVTKINPRSAIIFHDVDFSYGKQKVLSNIDFSISKGEYLGIVGPSGAGKTTLVQLIPGLLRATKGNVYVDGRDVADKTTDLKMLRSKIGFVFQYPEQQLFSKNVYEDVVFGPRNIGVSEIEAEKRAYEAIELVGLSQDIYDLPFTKLSGGQKRRVALAGVLAMKPEYLILDEPTAGLDPEGRREMLTILQALHKEAGITIVVVSHDAEAMAMYADRVVYMEDGAVKAIGKPEQVYYKMWESSGEICCLPGMTQTLVSLRAAGMPVKCVLTDFEAGINEMEQALQM